MKVFINQRVRRLFIAIGLFLLAGLIAGQALVWFAVTDYKNSIITHDAALAGALLQSGLDSASVAAIFTSPKTDEQRFAGRLVLKRAGVSRDLDDRLIVEVDQYRVRYGRATLILSVIFTAMALMGLWYFFTWQDRRIEYASQAIDDFVHNREISGESLAAATLLAGGLEEGSWAQLFNAINGMAATLTAHIQKEQRDRVFLKETISDISHQLKTPMSALKMYIEIIRDETPTNPMIADFISKSEHELERMEYLIRNLLKLARLDAGAIALNKRSLTLSGFLEDALESFMTRAEVEGKTLKMICPIELTLDGDEYWLAEAISNVVKNAFDHTTMGGTVNVVCEETPLLVTIAVEDNGSGIHPEDLPFVFKRFYRSRFSQDQQGIGIGLTLAYSIVERHGGSMTVESELGKGAVFRMIFPKMTNL